MPSGFLVDFQLIPCGCSGATAPQNDSSASHSRGENVHYVRTQGEGVEVNSVTGSGGVLDIHYSTLKIYYCNRDILIAQKIRSPHIEVFRHSQVEY